MQHIWRQLGNNVNLDERCHERTLKLGDVEECEGEITACVSAQRTAWLELAQEFEPHLIV